jgi:hypothetical protein
MLTVIFTEAYICKLRNVYHHNYQIAKCKQFVGQFRPQLIVPSTVILARVGLQIYLIIN